MTDPKGADRAVRRFLISGVVIIAGILLLTPSDVVGDEDVHSVEIPLNEIGNGTGTLSQLNANKVLADVTSSNKQTYTTVAVHTGANSPFTFRMQAECSPGTHATAYNITTIHSGGTLTELRFIGPRWLRWVATSDTYGYQTGKDVTLNVLSQDSIDAADFHIYGGVPQGQTYPQAMIGDIKQQAVELCNQRLGNIKQSHPNLSLPAAFIQSGGVYELHWNSVEMQDVCLYHVVSVNDDGSGEASTNTDTSSTDELTVVGRVRCISPYEPPQTAGSLAVGFGVYSASLEAQPSQYKGACPKLVNFNAQVNTQGTGQLKVQVLNEKNEVRETRTIDVTDSGPQKFTFTDTWDYAPTSGPDGLTLGGGGEGGPGLTAVPPPPNGGGGAPTGPGDVAANPTPPNVHNGWYKLKVVEPADTGVESNIAYYSIDCEKPPPGATVAAFPTNVECVGGVVESGRCVCDSGEVAGNGRCGPAGLAVPAGCQGGTYFGGECVCSEGETLRDGQCIPSVVIDCSPGFVRLGGTCVPQQCPANSHLSCVANLAPRPQPPPLPPATLIPAPPLPSAVPPAPTAPPSPPAPRPPPRALAIPPASSAPQAFPPSPPASRMGPLAAPPPTNVIVCTGGTPVGGRCICPPGQSAIATGAEAFRCAAQQPQQAVITCTGGSVRAGQCFCPSGWQRQTITITRTGEVYNCRPPSPGR